MSQAVTLLFVAHLAATLAMTGLIWFVQVVHYPLFAGVVAADGGANTTGGTPGDDERWRAYAAAHARRTTWVVAAPMLVELGTGVALLRWRPPFLPALWAAAGLALLAVVWLSTWRLQVPCHDQLGRGWEARVHRRLVRGNWLRTAAWAARAALLLGALARALAMS